MSLDAESWLRIKAALGQALELAPDERPGFLDAAYKDSELRRRVHSYLAAYDSASLRIGASGPAGDFAESEPLDFVEPIGPYRLLRRLGSGGMGEVFLAEQEGPIRRTVALKLIRSGAIGPQVTARFAAERQALALMNHPNIARVFDAGESRAGRPYVAMEYIDGPILTVYCDARELPPCERLQLFLAVCRGVQHAHQKGVIHRDLKPGNVLVAIEDGQAVPRIIDFGVAKAIAGDGMGTPLLTEQGQWIGTPDYMSPEQAGGSEGEIDTRSDVYSLGVLLYELLTGVLPFDPQELRREGLAALLATLRGQEPPRMSSRVRALASRAAAVARPRGLEPARLEALLRGDLDAIVRKALEKDPDRRYVSVAELAEDIARYLRHEPILAGTPGTGAYLRKLVRRHRFGFAAAGLVLLSLLAGIVGTGWSLVRALRAEHSARNQATRAEEEAAKSEQVTRFLFDIFQTADPSQSLRPDVTVREMLDQGAKRIRTELADQPLVQAKALVVMGRTYQALGQFDTAKSLFEQSLVIQRRRPGDAEIDTGFVLHDLAWVSIEVADYPKARSLLREALSIETKHLGPTDPAVASSLNLLGTALKRSGERDQARKSFERALAIYDRPGVAYPVEVAMVLDNLGLLLAETGKNEQARALLERALGLHERTLGPRHPSLSFSLNNLAMAVANLGDIPKARALLTRAVEIDRATFGPNHPNVAIGLCNLAELAQDEGDCRGAVALYEQSAAIFRGHFAADHPRVREITRLLQGARSCLAATIR